MDIFKATEVAYKNGYEAGMQANKKKCIACVNYCWMINQGNFWCSKDHELVKDATLCEDFKLAPAYQTL